MLFTNPTESLLLTNKVMPAKAGIQNGTITEDELDSRQSLSRTRCGAGMTVKKKHGI